MLNDNNLFNPSPTTICIFFQAFRDLWNNTRLVNVVEQMVGPEVAAHANWNLRPKAPGHAETLVP